MLQYFFISIIVVILLKELYDTYNEKLLEKIANVEEKID